MAFLPFRRRRTHRAPAAGAALACTASLSLLISMTQAPAQASPGSSLNPAVSELISTITDSESELNQLDLKIGELREAVNQALVELQDARSKSTQAAHGVQAAKDELNIAQEDVDEAQGSLDEISRSQYRRSLGSPGVRAVSGQDSRDDELYRRSFMRNEAEDKVDTVRELDRVRTEKANKESQLREVHQLAEQRAQQASESEEQARKVLDDATARIAEHQERRAELESEHQEAQQELADVRGIDPEPVQDNESGASQTDSPDTAVEDPDTASTPANAQSQPEAQRDNDAEVEQNAAGAEETQNPGGAEAGDAEQDAPDTEQVEQNSAGTEETQNPGAELVDTVSQAVNSAAEIVAEHQPNHTELEAPTAPQAQEEQPIPALQSSPDNESAEAEGEAASAPVQGPESSAEIIGGLSSVLEELDTNDTVTDDASEALEDVAPSDQVSAVLSRARSQLGVDYAWGGGNAQGPTKGIRDGANGDANGDYNKIGFDCSGLVQYAFAGVGISLPHYSGGQYRHGTQVPTSQLQPGDLIFYGPGGGQHVAIYSGNGMMIEAPHSGAKVREVEVRHSGMSEYAVRLLG